ncbi:urea ABC transporter permease subunit UrtC [Luteolibacter arcticus]|uniref:Urea ABC transporter permease subunit UrtC n=1 Tax=Luteolibacter arcticus TaxID=1581411 RepID=A0ABT3GJN9_9BACT|nr:urea ABC transporter permease subunit UrtC [Luteolibacter arcticus]MCW1923742.1 urea ABC transporter permease subunit UrtC [Luteolibacter arcticus]
MNTSLSAKAPTIGLAAVALFLVVGMPALNAAGVIEDFYLNTWGKYLCYAILAISVDLLWGYTGLLCLGQSLFFSLGGYMFGMHLMLMIGPDAVYKSALPDFMDFMGRKELPGFWEPFHSFPFAALMVFLLPGLLAGIFGYLAFRSRIKGVYFSILTQALTYGAALMFFRNELYMGGNNGFTDFRSILGADIRLPETKRMLYIASAVTLVLVFIFCKWLTTSRYGLIQRAIRDSENRVLFSGYSAANFKLFVFVISGMIAAIGGALYVPQVGIINPSEMMTEKSLEAVVWVAVGGRGTLFGPIIGAIAVNAFKSWASNKFPDLWPLILGGSFVLVVLFMPKGIVGIPGQIRALIARREDRRLAAAEDELLNSAAKTK